MEVTSGLHYKNHVRITSESGAWLTLGTYVIKTSAVINLGSYVGTIRRYVRFRWGNYVIKPVKWKQLYGNVIIASL